jgi:hypothetical protein
MTPGERAYFLDLGQAWGYRPDDSRTLQTATRSRQSQPQPFAAAEAVQGNN